VVTELASLVDKLSRNQGFQSLIDMLGNPDVQERMVKMCGAVSSASTEVTSLPPSRGGFGGMWGLMTDPAMQDAMRFMVLVSKHLKKG